MVQVYHSQKRPIQKFLDPAYYCTSMKIPSTPTTTAVLAMHGINSQKPPLATLHHPTERKGGSGSSLR